MACVPVCRFESYHLHHFICVILQWVIVILICIQTLLSTYSTREDAYYLGGTPEVRDTLRNNDERFDSFITHHFICFDTQIGKAACLKSSCL